MKLKLLAAAATAALTLTGTAALAGPAPAADGAPDLVYSVLFLKDGQILSSPTVAGQFGQPVRIEVSGLMRVEVEADAPGADTRSRTTARLSLYRDGAWGEPKVMTMPAMLTKTPSFEYSVPGTPYRFVVMPRMIVPAAGAGQP